MAASRFSRLREERVARGLSQAELAARAGVSRQLVAAVEAGHNTPAVDAGLRLARALGTSVESLFSPGADELVPALAAPLGEGAPLRVGRVGERLVAAELADHGTAGAGWARPDGTLRDGRLHLFAGAVPAGLVVAGCDPALAVAETMLAGLGPRSLLALSSASGIALHALGRDTVHAAVVHGPAGELPAAPVPVVRLQLARWRVGLGLASTVVTRSLEEVLEGPVPVVQREPGAASQQALARAAGAVGAAVAPGRRAGGHIEAARMAAVLGCAAVTTEAAAHAFGLRFLALEEHTVEIWLAERWFGHPAVSALGELLGGQGFRERVGQFGGYDLAGCGQTVAG